MIINKNVHLAPKTTMKIGGYADTFYIPENEDELIHVTQAVYDKKRQVYILSGGSNLLINDNKRFEEIIYMGAACPEMYALGEGKFYIGASCRIQKVIAFVNGYEYGGFEGLVGLPAMFGGIIYMNAGLGGGKNPLFTISDFIESVKVWDLEEKKVKELTKGHCSFAHRYSIFHNQRYVILGAVIQCHKLSSIEAKKVKDARTQFCRDKFEYGKGCFGTCFSKANYKILKAASLIYSVRKRSKERVSFAENNKNWLVNRGDGKYEDVICIIDLCKRMHRLCRKEVQCEVVIWD